MFILFQILAKNKVFPGEQSVSLWNKVFTSMREAPGTFQKRFMVNPALPGS